MRRRFLIAPILMIGIVLAPAYAGWLEDAKGALEGMGKKGADKAADTAIEGAKGKAKGSGPQEVAPQRPRPRNQQRRRGGPVPRSELPPEPAGGQQAGFPVLFAPVRAAEHEGGSPAEVHRGVRRGVCVLPPG